MSHSYFPGFVNVNKNKNAMCDNSTTVKLGADKPGIVE
jgi:hypothetical protein